jgi:hypothetical protein
MATTVFSVTKGMTVYASDGQKVGTVGEVLSGQPETRDSEGMPYADVSFTPSGPISPEPTAPEDVGDDQPVVQETVPAPIESDGVQSGATSGGGAPAGFGAPLPDAGAVELTPSDTKYFEVKHGGILGIGGEHLDVPFSAVEDVAPGDSVTLKCTLDDCTRRYSERPAPLSEG